MLGNNEYSIQWLMGLAHALEWKTMNECLFSEGNEQWQAKEIALRYLFAEQQWP
jgi:hypothetical protein